MLERLKKILYRYMSNNEVDYNTAKQMLKQNSNSILLDVRSKQEYEEEHIPGSINISLYDLEKQAKNVLKDKDQLIITCCASGSRSKQAQELLENMGYKEVYNLKGGLNEINII